MAEAEDGGVATSSSSPQPPPAPRKTSKGRLVISRQSMETAFAAVCKAYVPRPGQPMSRTREEVTALAQVGTVFSPLFVCTHFSFCVCRPQRCMLLPTVFLLFSPKMIGLGSHKRVEGRRTKTNAFVRSFTPPSVLVLSSGPPPRVSSPCTRMPKRNQSSQMYDRIDAFLLARIVSVVSCVMRNRPAALRTSLHPSLPPSLHPIHPSLPPSHKQHDRHEQALVTNVILPKDIGVTYDMIGGLGGAKELLRQCITYPLRFPHLYSEGIAKEAVKGVLLFGPPGEPE